MTAEQLIQHARETQATVLDLGNCGLTELPDLSGLESVTTLILASVYWQLEENIGFRIRQESQNRGEKNQLFYLKGIEVMAQVRTLYLNDIKLSDISPLTNLKNLQNLDFCENQVSDISPLTNLKNLQYLYFSYNQVSNISPLINLNNLQRLDFSSNQVSDISPLINLNNLQYLYFGENKVSDISHLTNLNNLQYLEFSHNQVSDISPLKILSTYPRSFNKFREGNIKDTWIANLKHLFFKSNLVSDISPLKNLKNLQNLSFSYNQVSDISPLVNLKNLQCLEFSYNQVSDISPLANLIKNNERTLKWDSYSTERGIYLAGNPITNPPKEIIKQGNEAILQFLKNADRERLYEGKILIVGEGGAGKTTLRDLIVTVDENVLMKALSSITKLISAKKKESMECSTRGIDVVRHSFQREEGKSFIMNIWDFGGQQIYHATHRFFLSERALYIVVMDLRRDSDGFDYWLESVEKFGKDSPVLLLLNQRAGREHFAIDEGNIRKRFQYVKVISSFNLRSEEKKDKEELAKFIQNIQLEMQRLPLVGSVVPKPWKEVREAVAQLAKSKSTIDKYEYEQLCKNCGVGEKEEIQVLSRYFHDLGVFLHFHESPLLKHLVILQNTWATDAVYKLIDDPKIIKQEGRFQKKVAEQAWKESDYRDKCDELLELMAKFELLYEIPNKKTHYIMPQLLKDKIPDKLNWQDSKDDLIIRYEYDFMPKGLITHIIVRLHEYIENHEMVWQKGSVFYIQDARAKIYAQYGNRVIEVRAQGRNRKELATLLSNDIDKLNATFEKLGDKKKVPCNCHICAHSENPYMFTYQLLYANHKNGTLKIVCENEGEAEVKTMLYGNFIPEPIQKVRNIIAKGEIDDALAYLAHITGEANEVILLQARFAQHEDAKSRMTSEEYEVNLNQITHDILNLVNRLDEEDAWSFSMKMARNGGDFEREMRGEFIRIREKLADIHADTQAIKVTLAAHQQKLLGELQNLSSDIRYEQGTWEKQLVVLDEKQTLAIQTIIKDVDFIIKEEGNKQVRKLLNKLAEGMTKQEGISQELKTLINSTERNTFDMDTQLKLKIPLIPSIPALPFFPTLEIEHSFSVDSGQILTNWWRDFKKSIFG